MAATKDPNLPSGVTIAESNQALTQDVTALQLRVATLEKQVAQMSSQIAMLTTHVHTYSEPFVGGTISLVDLKLWINNSPDGGDLSAGLARVFFSQPPSMVLTGPTSGPEPPPPPSA
jgi:hypothetical protein